jgi:serine/threonine-protein kinase
VNAGAPGVSCSLVACPSCDAETEAGCRTCPDCGAPLPLEPGTLIAQRYEVQAQLGGGGMGTVYRVRDRALHVTVALKVMRLDADPSAVRRFHHEVTLARKVKHENVCSVYEFGEDEGLLYCTMELVGGKNLRQVLREQGQFPGDRAYDVALQAASGLKAIHEAGVLHRDLKATNIMIGSQERVRVVDFGIAKAMASGTEDETPSTPITGPHSVVGTPEYMSPEQVMGWPLDVRSDIYSFGVVLFELFTGNVPFKGTNRAATMRKHLEEPPPFEGPLARALPIHLVPILARALAKDPDRRQGNMGELILELERARDAFKAETFSTLAGRRARRESLLVLPALVALLVLLLRTWHPGGSKPPPLAIPIPAPTPSTMVPPSRTTPSPRPPLPRPVTRRDRRPSPSSIPTPAVPTASTIAGATIATTTTSVPVTTTTTAPTTTTTTTPTTPALAPIPVEEPPQCLTCPSPPYPPAAERYGLEGDVEIEIDIDASGKVTSARMLKGHAAFRDAALKVARAWRFAPATRDGVPVKCSLVRTVQFRLQPRPDR